jgi:hypothetical protein
MPLHPTSNFHDKARKAKAVRTFFARAEIKDCGEKGWYAYISGETPDDILLFLKDMFPA